jgi:hypothetical protein
MEQPLSGAGWTIMLILGGFIIAINLSLVFAFLHRNRDQQEMRRPRAQRPAPWESKLAGPSEELNRRVAGLRAQAGDKKDDPRPPSSS